MPELVQPDWEEVTSELLVALRPLLCRVEPCPDLNGPSFQMRAASLGQLIYIVPDAISQEEATKQIADGQLLATKNNFHIVSDCRPGQVLHLRLQNGPLTDGWKPRMLELLNRLSGADQWEMAFLESIGDQKPAHFGLLRAGLEDTEQQQQQQQQNPLPREEGQRDIWMAPVSRRIVAGCTKRMVKKKVIRKVLRKPSREEPTANGTSTSNGTANGELSKEEKQQQQTKDSKAPSSESQPLQNGTAHAALQSPKLNGGGIVGRIANLFNGMGGGSAESRAGRGRSQSLEEPPGKVPGAKQLKRADSDGTDSSRKELTPEKGTEQLAKTIGGQNERAEQGMPTCRSPSQGFVRIPVQLNGSSSSPPSELKVAEQQNGIVEIGEAPKQQRWNGPIPQSNGKEPANRGSENAVNTMANGSTKLQNGTTGSHGSDVSSSSSSSSTLCRPVVTANRVLATTTKEGDAKEAAPTPPVLKMPTSPPAPSIGSKEQQPHSPESADSDSPNYSFHSAISSSEPSPLLGRGRWRRADDAATANANVPSASIPSTSLLLQGTSAAQRRQGPITVNGGGTGHRLLGPPPGSLLSPISSCGSVEEGSQGGQHQQQQNSQQQYGADDREPDGDEEDEESTLMLLNRERASAGTLGGEDGDELSCSLDFSLASISQKLPPTSSSSAGITTSAAIAQRLAAARRQMLQHRVQSPSPPKQAISSASPAAAVRGEAMVRGMLGKFRMPVPALQQVIGLFSFKEIGELRRVHPHWDELCGQLMNAAYNQLLHRAQRGLTDCQRRLNREPRMAQPVQLLTRLHVHVLNPVDGMRAFMDEGVLCFPYGALLDCAFAMLNRAEAMASPNSAFENQERREQEYDDASIQMDQLADMARRAAAHYRQWVEPEAEKRMSELYRASAQQRLQRIDSFLVESSVTRVERDATKARNELGWEMEQLREQNQQLRKENRELKQLCQRLDQRVDVLERKFKTMARLLQ